MNEPTCWTLIRSAAAGESASREAFGRRYEAPIRAFLQARWRTTPLRNDVDDAVQDVFLACFKADGALVRAQAATKGFRAFLFGVTRNVALQLERAQARRVRRTRSAELSFDVADAAPSPAERFDQEYARTIVHEAIQTMHRRARLQGDAAMRRVELLRARFEDGRPVRDIAVEWRTDATRLHLESAKAAREFRSALREVVGIAEKCAPARVDAECERLLELLD